MWLRFKAVKNASEGLFDTWKNSTIKKKPTNNFVAFDYPITNKNHWALFFLEGFSDVDIQHGIANNKGLTIVNHIYIYTHIHTHIHIHIHIHMYVCLYIHIYRCHSPYPCHHHICGIPSIPKFGGIELPLNHGISAAKS